MAVDPRKICLFVPPGLRKFKLDLFERIGRKIGQIVRHDYEALRRLPRDVLPVVGCTPELRPLIDEWQISGRPWCYWDRGYMRRVFATDLPFGADGGYYRWHLGSFQMQEIREVPEDRWRSMKIEVWPWSKSGRQIVVAEPTPTYARFHGIEGWTERTVQSLKMLTDRPVVLRDKEMQRFGRKLRDDLRGAHALVAHGSNAAVEAAVMGCPVFVDRCSAASLVGLTDLSEIENPVYPDRTAWVRSLCYSQFNERELVDGTLWRLIQ